jgi:hypothetical protein
MEKLSSVLKSGRGLGEKAWSLVPSKSVLSGLALAAVSGAALFAIGQRIYVNVRTKRIVQKDAEPKHLFVLVPGYLGSPSQMQSVPRTIPPRDLCAPFSQSPLFCPVIRVQQLARLCIITFYSLCTLRYLATRLGQRDKCVAMISTANCGHMTSLFKTLDGIDVGGHRLADEVRAFRSVDTVFLLFFIEFRC